MLKTGMGVDSQVAQVHLIAKYIVASSFPCCCRSDSECGSEVVQLVHAKRCLCYRRLDIARCWMYSTWGIVNWHARVMCGSTHAEQVMENCWCMPAIMSLPIAASVLLLAVTEWTAYTHSPLQLLQHVMRHT